MLNSKRYVYLMSVKVVYDAALHEIEYRLSKYICTTCEYLVSVISPYINIAKKSLLKHFKLSPGLATRKTT